MNLTIRVNPPSIGRIMGRQENIDLDKEKIRAFCEVNGIQRLSLFGSVLTDRFGPESDVDVLIDFLPGSVPGFFRLAAIEADLAKLFGKARVDLRTPQDLSRHFRDQVLATAEVQYAR